MSREQPFGNGPVKIARPIRLWKPCGRESTLSRREDLDEFYDILGGLRVRLGGCRRLADCHGRMPWPERGVYFFFESGETREDGRTDRVVRVGTHAISSPSRAKFWTRLYQHRGPSGGGYAGGGSHRGSVFRELMGEALLESGGFEQVRSTWGGRIDPPGVRRTEHVLEMAVSERIRAMPFLWLEVNDEPSPLCRRRMIELNAIALLSNFHREPIDSPSLNWLGRRSPWPRVRESGLWNRNDVDRNWDSSFLALLRSAGESCLRP